MEPAIIREALGYLAYLAAVVALSPLAPHVDRLTGATDRKAGR